MPRITPPKFSATSRRQGSAVMGIKVRLRHPRPLLRAGLELIHALNAFRPLGRKGYVTFLAFWFGWRSTEVPHLVMAASMIDAVRRARRGDFTGRRGTSALALTAASWAIPAVIYRRGVASRPQFLDPLREELGIDYTDAPASLQSPPPPTRWLSSCPGCMRQDASPKATAAWAIAVSTQVQGPDHRRRAWINDRVTKDLRH